MLDVAEIKQKISAGLIPGQTDPNSPVINLKLSQQTFVAQITNYGPIDLAKLNSSNRAVQLFRLCHTLTMSGKSTLKYLPSFKLNPGTIQAFYNAAARPALFITYIFSLR